MLLPAYNPSERPVPIISQLARRVLLPGNISSIIVGPACWSGAHKTEAVYAVRCRARKMPMPEPAITSRAASRPSIQTLLPVFGGGVEVALVQVAGSTHVAGVRLTAALATPRRRSTRRPPDAV